MKNLFLSLIALFSLLKGVSGQSNVISEEVLIGEVQPINELNYFFFFGNQLKDIRNFSTVIDGIQSGELKELEDGRIVICSQAYYGRNVFATFNKNNRLIKKFEIPGYLSPNWDYVIKLKDGDLWREDINFNTGTTHNERQITQLGLFEKNLAYKNWYGDYVFFQPYWDKQDHYLLNTLDGSMEKVDFQFSDKAAHSSPTGRFFLIYKEDSFGIFDFEKKDILNDISGYNDFWVNETTIAFNEENNELGENSLRIIDLEKPETSYPITYYEGKMGNGSRFNNFSHFKGGTEYSEIKKLLVSPIIESNYYFFNGWNENEYKVILFNLTTGQSLIWADNEKQLHSGSITSFGQKIEHAWINRDEVVYCLRGDLTEQGTWLLNCKTGEKKKITPFLAEQFWNFENIGYVMFEANNNLYSYNNDKGLKVLQENFSRYKKIKVLKSRY